jgi:hypothetical protein
VTQQMELRYHGRWRDEAGNVVLHMVTSNPQDARQWRARSAPGATLTITQCWTATISSPEEPAELGS